MDLKSMSPPLTLAQVCQVIGITQATLREWEQKGVAPKRSRVPGYSRPRVLSADLQEWLAQREADRQRTGRWHLRHPLAAN